LSPDEDAILVRLWAGNASHIARYDLNRNVAVPLTLAGDSNSFPRWSPDGRTMAFQSNRAGPYTLFTMPVDGSGEAERLLEDPSGFHQHPSWSPDGKSLVYTDVTLESRSTLWILPMDEPGAGPTPFLATEFNAHSPEFSPDGRFLAYVSNESGREEIYLTEFAPANSGSRARETVSRDGGWEPCWSPDGTELYYRSYDGTQLMVARVRTSPSLEIGEPEELLDISRMPPPIPFGGRSYDVSRDGRFLMIVEDDTGQESMNLAIVLNWFQELEQLVPTH
jgi:Tol biopolymer transport system component